jgi:hypothetical protein
VGLSLGSSAVQASTMRWMLGESEKVSNDIGRLPSSLAFMVVSSDSSAVTQKGFSPVTMCRRQTPNE